MTVFPNTEWHQKEEIRDQLEGFYEKYALTSKLEKDNAFKHFQIYMEYLESRLKAKEIIKGVEFIDSSSSYDGTNISNDTLNFASMLLVDGSHIKFIKVLEYPEYFSLRVKETSTPMFEGTFNIGSLDTRKLTEKLFSEIQKTVNTFKSNSEVTIKLRNKISVICLDVYAKNTLWFNIDLIPSFLVNENGELCIFFFFCLFCFCYFFLFVIFFLSAIRRCFGRKRLNYLFKLAFMTF